MFIRSQDKKVIVEAKIIRVQPKSKGTYSIMAGSTSFTFDNGNGNGGDGDGLYTVGEYKDEKRAMEIMDKIYAWMQGYGEGKYKNIIFQMPKE